MRYAIEWTQSPWYTRPVSGTLAQALTVNVIPFGDRQAAIQFSKQANRLTKRTPKERTWLIVAMTHDAVGCSTVRRHESSSS
jgi:hypothetical protein